MVLTVNRTTHGLIQSYLSSLDCPRSLAVWIMFKENEHDQILQLSVDPDSYLDPNSFRDAYLATKFLSKANFLSTKIDLKKTAIDEFIRCEGVCKEVNKDGFRSSQKKFERFEWLHSATKQIVRAILTDFDADEFFDCANWGPGVSTLIRGDTSSTNKFRLEGGITRPLHDFIGGIFATAYPHWSPKFEIQFGNRVVTVPKNSKTDRTIAIEPGINLWFQKSIGNMIRRRLQRFGLDLNSQKRNQHLCYLASKFGKMATVDFSSASDSISIATVEELLPLRWFTLMDLVRSKSGLIEGTPIQYEKFSSMGNGFTFELESLIFFAIGLAVCNYLKVDKKNFSVYGDDVVIPVHALNLFRKMCELYGFTINMEKSFTFPSVFRESCGEHYFSGVGCKPYYLKEVVKRESEIYIAHNNVKRVSRLFYGLDSRFNYCCGFLIECVPAEKRCYISEGLGDSGFIVNFDEALPSKARHGIEGYLTKALLCVPVGYSSYDQALLLARLKDYSAPNRENFSQDRDYQPIKSILFLSSLTFSESFGNETFLRGKVRYIRKNLLVQQWTDLGPWI